jgi:hypothetical protein
MTHRRQQTLKQKTRTRVLSSTVSEIHDVTGSMDAAMAAALADKQGRGAAQGIDDDQHATSRRLDGNGSARSSQLSEYRSRRSESPLRGNDVD